MQIIILIVFLSVFCVLLLRNGASFAK